MSDRWRTMAISGTIPIAATREADPPPRCPTRNSRRWDRGSRSIANDQLVKQIWRYLAVFDTLDREVDRAVLRRGRRDRVGAFRLVSIGRRQANVDMLRDDGPAAGKASETVFTCASRCGTRSRWQSAN
jgi:hypothetical protein